MAGTVTITEAGTGIGIGTGVSLPPISFSLWQKTRLDGGSSLPTSKFEHTFLLLIKIFRKLDNTQSNSDAEGWLLN